MAAQLDETAEIKLRAASHRLPEQAAFSGRTAAWLHGISVEPCDPIEITVRAPTTVATRAGMRVRRRSLDKRDIVTVRGYPVTSAIKTLCDICRGLSLTEAVVIVDEALHKALVDVDALRSSRSLARLVDYVEPRSESQMESRLRMLLVLAGLPKPEAQVPIRNRWHQFLGRPDLYYREQKLGIEYDGSTHRDSLPEDNQRQNRLLDAGVRLLRFTGTDVYNNPVSVVTLVRSALAA